MTTKSIFYVFLLISLSLLVIVSSSVTVNPQILTTCQFDTIYQLGDSTSDTGNFIRDSPLSPFARLPYGQDFSLNSTGRSSNGLLIIDYLAMSSGLPLLDAYSNPNGTFDHGLNFAVAGSTAMLVTDLAAQNISNPATNNSLMTQIDELFLHLFYLCENQTDTECAQKTSKSALFIVGDIGANDYNYALFQGKKIEQVKALVPQVVAAIKMALSEVTWYGGVYGASRIIVPGSFPIGCLPNYLTRFQTNDSSAYDEFHCLKDLNNLASYHNELLQQAIQEIRIENPNSVLVYGDYFNAYEWMLENAKSLGFDESSMQKACCGVGGDYDFSFERLCGSPGVTVCPNPDKRISWDGIHFTQKAYQHMTSWLIHDIFPKLACRV
ncbi:hypothetical protein ACFE04_027326 [Oxalis oulophora]